MIRVMIFIMSFILFLFTFSSCQQKVKKRDKLKTLVIKEFEGKEIRSDKYFPGMKLLPLRLDTNQFIGKVKDVCMAGDTVFLLDEITATLYSIDKKDGKCLASVCKRGNGPDEYIQPVALSVHAGKLYVLDMPTSRIIVFDRDLKVVKSIQFDFPAFDFIALDTGFLLYNVAPTEKRNKFVYINGQGEYVNSFVSTEQAGHSNVISGVLGKVFVRNKEAKIFAFESYSDVVYEWENGSLNPVCRIDFGKLNVPADVDKNKVNLFEEPYAFSSNLFMLSDLFISSFFYKSQRYYGFISLSSKGQEVGIVKDEQSHVPFYPQWQQGDELIGVCSYESLKTHFETNPISGKHLDETLDQEDLVLVFY